MHKCVQDFVSYSSLLSRMPAKIKCFVFPLETAVGYFFSYTKAKADRFLGFVCVCHANKRDGFVFGRIVNMTGSVAHKSHIVNFDLNFHPIQDPAQALYEEKLSLKH